MVRGGSGLHDACITSTGELRFNSLGYASGAKLQGTSRGLRGTFADTRPQQSTRSQSMG